MFDDDDDNNDEPDDEYPDEADSDDETATARCPQCGAEVYEDAEYCPACDSYITPGDNALSNKPLWWILLGLAGIVAALLALTGFLSW